MKKILKLEEIRKTLSFKTQTINLVFRLEEFLDSDFYLLDFDVFLPSKNKNLQRELCWTLQQKQELIKSVLKGIKLSDLKMIQKKIKAEKPDSIRQLQVIDGKQRLTTLLSFLKNEFPLEVNGEEYFYDDLDQDAKNVFSISCPAVEIAYEYVYSDGIDNVIISDDEKIAWFEMINFAGTPQDIEHLNNLKS